MLKCIKVERKNSDLYFGVGSVKETYKVLGIEECRVSVKSYRFTNKFLFHCAQIHGSGLSELSVFLWINDA